MNLITTLQGKLGPRVGLGTLVLKKYSPEIMITTGIGSGIISAVLLAKAHKKSEDEFEDIFELIQEVRDVIEENNSLIKVAEEEGIELPEENNKLIEGTDAFRLYAPLYLEFAKKAATLYGPPILFGIFSVLMIVGSHGILRKRNQALFSSVLLLERGFNAYRERVREELGQDKDDQFYYGLQRRKKTIIEEGPDGKKKKKKVEENVLGEEITPVLYQRVFDTTNINWSNSERTNHFWLGLVQQMMNDELSAKGWLLLNDVYEALGFDETSYGAIVGWSLAAPGDDYVNFGFEKPFNDDRPDGSFLLDFNVNGYIYNYIGVKTPFKSFP